MLWDGKTVTRWRRWFALFPVAVGGTYEKPLYCWLAWYEWRYHDIWRVQFERRAIGARETFKTEIGGAG